MQTKTFYAGLSQAYPVTQGTTMIHGVNKSPGLASSAGAPSRVRSGFIAPCQLHGYWVGPELSSDSYIIGSKEPPMRIAAQIHRLFICRDHYIRTFAGRQFRISSQFKNILRD